MRRRKKSKLQSLQIVNRTNSTFMTSLLILDMKMSVKENQLTNLEVFADQNGKVVRKFEVAKLKIIVKDHQASNDDSKQLTIKFRSYDVQWYRKVILFYQVLKWTISILPSIRERSNTIGL